MRTVLLFMLFAAAYYLTHRLYLVRFRKQAFRDIAYSVKLSHDERFSGETVSFSQTVTNRRFRPIPCVKVETTLPVGLAFILPDGKGGEKRERHVESVFFLPARASVTRTWFLSCNNRGEYALGEAILLVEEPLGTFSLSEKMETAARLRVLPTPEEKLNNFALQDFFQSSHSEPRGFLPEYSLIRGVREYTPRDPFHTIHWKASAKQGRLLSREYDFQKTDIYNIFLNMQSRRMEPHGGLDITRPDHIEDCIRVCASLLDSAAAQQVPISLYANCPAETEGELYCSGDFCGQDDLPAAYRMLAALPMQMSMQAEKMLDLILADPAGYARGGKLVFVSAYVDRRMLRFAENMRGQGIDVTFFITTTYQNDWEIPRGVTVYVRYEGGEYREVCYDNDRTA